MYCLCFYLFTSEKAETSRGIVLTALFVGGLQLYIQTEADAAAAQLRVGKTIRAVNDVSRIFHNLRAFGEGPSMIKAFSLC